MKWAHEVKHVLMSRLCPKSHLDDDGWLGSSWLKSSSEVSLVGRNLIFMIIFGHSLGTPGERPNGQQRDKSELCLRTHHLEDRASNFEIILGY